MSKEASFFEPSRYRRFEVDIANLKFKVQPKAIQQLSLKTYGYGYFDQIQTQMKDNFLQYLKQAIQECSNLKSLKIEFNGYSIKDKSLLKIINIIERLLEMEGRDIETIWIHTRILRDCQIEMIKEMLSLTDTLISRKKFQEISLQLAGWEFANGPLTYKEFNELFSGFAGNIMLMGEHNLKRLRLDLSSLYMSDLQSYNYLKNAVPLQNLVESIENQRFN